MKKILIITIVFILGFNIPYKYNSEQTVQHVQQHAMTHSKCMCAWYVMRSLQSGGCFPCGIYPAYAYEDILPRLGFAEIQESEVQQGDICVLSQNSKSGFGHIAIYDGKQWISDFKQKSKYPGTVYRTESTIKYFRQSDGWHTANIWIWPHEVIEYIITLFNNFYRIKLW